MTGNTKLLTIVKANAYGHGIVDMSKQLENLNVDALGVATVEEGVRIREAGVKIPIIVLFQHFKNEAEDVCRYDLTPIISNAECLDDYDRFLKNHNKKLKLHIKVDTGLNRMGAKPKDVLSLANKILSYETLEIEGINTHYAASDGFDDISKEFTENQIKIFSDVLNELKTNGIKINNAHTANSAALLYYKNAYFDMVRAGIVVYGYTEKLYDFGFKPILNLKSKVILTRKIKKNETVSYGMTWKADKDTNIAVIPIGYADGLSRKLSNNWEVKINGKYYDYDITDYDPLLQYPNGGYATMWVDTNLTMTPQASGTTPEYKITEGANSSWKQNSDDTLKFVANGDFSKFTGVKLDGTLVATDKYTAVSGSTVITLKKDYLSTLSVGKHTLTIVYNDGECSTEFEIKAASITSSTDSTGNNSGSTSSKVNKPDTSETTSPKTGDTNNMFLWFIILFVSGSVTIGTLMVHRKKQYNR